MNPADVLLSTEYPSLSPLPMIEDETAGLSSGLGVPALSHGAIATSADSAIPEGQLQEMSPDNVAQILVAVNRSLGIDLGELDYVQFIVLEGQEDDDTRRSRDGKREYTHIQLVCEACGHIIMAVAKAVQMALADAGDDPEARSGIPKRKKGGILGFKELAAKAKLSPWHFHRVFRSITEVTPKAYGEACWDYLLRINGFDVEPKSPIISEKHTSVPAPASGRIAKSGSRSRSRSRPRHSSQTQQQVLSALAGGAGSDEVVRKHRSRSAARSSSFSSSRFVQDFSEPPQMRVPQAVLGAPQIAANTPIQLEGTPGGIAIPLNSSNSNHNLNNGLSGSLGNLGGSLNNLGAPHNMHGSHSGGGGGTFSPSLGNNSHMLGQPPHSVGPGGPGGQANTPMQQPLQFLPPGTVAGSIGQDFMSFDPPSMYDNLYPGDSFIDARTPQLDSTVDSTPSTGLETIGDDQHRPYDMPDLNTLSLSKEYDWKEDDPSLAPFVADPELSSQFFMDKDYGGNYRELTPDFNNVKLMDPLEEPSLFKTEY